MSQLDDSRPDGSAVVRRGMVGGAQLHEWWKSQRPDFSDTEWNDNIYLELTPPPGTAPADVVAAMSTMVARHEALRTTFGFTERGIPEQIVHAPYRPALREYSGDAEDAQVKFLNGVRWHRFDITAQWPVCLGVVVDGDVRRVVASFPHVNVDGASWTTIRAEMEELLRATAEGRPPQLADVLRQPLDAADWEATRQGEAAGEAAVRHWAAELDTAPNRLFVSPSGGTFELYEGNWVSPTAPGVFEAAAALYGTSPAVTYSAAVHLLLAVLSGGDHSLVHSHFAGRAPDFADTVGCFHRLLFTTVEVADRPSLRNIVARTAANSLRAQRRYRYDYLRYREQEVLAMRRRGVSFSWGSTVNFTDGYEAAVTAAPAGTEMSIRPMGLVQDVVGMDAYLTVRTYSNRVEIQGGFSGNTLTVAQMELILRGPELVLGRALHDPDLSFDEIVTLLDPPAPAHAACQLTGGRVCDEAGTGRLLASHPAVTAAHLQRVDDGRLTAYVAASSAPDPCELREFMLDGLSPDLSLVCPDHFVICPAPPDGSVAWESLPRLAEGAGTPDRPASPGDDREHALHTAIRECHDLAQVDMARCYLESGGRLLLAPAVVRRTAELGYEGIEVEDLARPTSLARIAARLTTVLRS